MATENPTIQSLWTHANGVKMHARAALGTAPSGSPDIVLVHGLVVSSRYMRPLIEILAPDYRVYAPDLPGFGDSGEPGRTLTIPELADAMYHWMNEVGLERPLILGNSFGCQIAIEFGYRYPGRARGLVLVGPTVDRQGRNIPTQAARWILNSFGEPPSLGPDIVRDFFKAGFVRTVRTLRIYVRDAPEEKLPHVIVPTLVIRGAQDPIVPDRWVREIVGLLPDARLGVIPGAGHTANYAAPLEVARMARLFDRHPTYALTSAGG